MNKFKMIFLSFRNYFIFFVFLVSTFYDGNWGAVMSPVIYNPVVTGEYIFGVYMSLTSGRKFNGFSLSFRKSVISPPKSNLSSSSLTTAQPGEKSIDDDPTKKNNPFSMEFTDEKMQKIWNDMFDLDEDPSLECTVEEVTINLIAGLYGVSILAKAFYCGNIATENDQIYIINGYVHNSVITLKKKIKPPYDLTTGQLITDDSAPAATIELQELWHLSPELKVEGANFLWVSFLAEWSSATANISKSTKSIFTQNLSALCELLLAKEYTQTVQFEGSPRDNDDPLPDSMNVLSEKNVPILLCTVTERNSSKSHEYYVLQFSELSAFIVKTEDNGETIKVAFAESVGFFDFVKLNLIEIRTRSFRLPEASNTNFTNVK